MKTRAAILVEQNAPLELDEVEIPALDYGQGFGRDGGNPDLRIAIGGNCRGKRPRIVGYPTYLGMKLVVRFWRQGHV